MTATKTSKTAKDAEGQDFPKGVLDESGTGAGPFHGLHGSVNQAGAVINPASEDTLASLNSRFAAPLPIAPAVAPFVNRSGTIAAGGTSQVMATANAGRRRLIVQNPGSAAGQGIGSAESLFVNFTNAAAVDAGTSLELFPGGSFDTGGGPVTGEAVTIAAATTGHRFIAKEM